MLSYIAYMDPMGKASPVFKTVFRHISITCGSLWSFLTFSDFAVRSALGTKQLSHSPSCGSEFLVGSEPKAGVEIQLPKARSNMW
jgi:hypothetical protein